VESVPVFCFFSVHDVNSETFYKSCFDQVYALPKYLIYLAVHCCLSRTNYFYTVMKANRQMNKDTIPDSNNVFLGP